MTIIDALLWFCLSLFKVVGRTVFLFLNLSHSLNDRRNFGTLQAYIKGSMSEDKYKKIWATTENFLYGLESRHLQKFKIWIFIKNGKNDAQNKIKIIKDVPAIFLSLSRVWRSVVVEMDAANLKSSDLRLDKERKIRKLTASSNKTGIVKCVRENVNKTIGQDS